MTSNDQPASLPDGTHLAYVISHEAWYAQTPGVIDRPAISVAASAEGQGGGIAWGFVVEEASFETKGVHPISVRLFDDAFAAFAQIPGFFAALASESVADLRQVREVLDRMGAVDETQRER